MLGEFHNHPVKNVVRDNWNTPLLRHVFQLWGKKFLYFGLPGPEAIDVHLWLDMIHRVIAFETEDAGRTNDPRWRIAELETQLQLLRVKTGLVSSVYCGPMEEVVLRQVDHDGNELKIDEFVTLFNLDFTNPITGRVEVAGRKRCLRFEAIRALISWQRQLFRDTGSDRFVLFITVHNSLNSKKAEDVLLNDELPNATRKFIEKALAQRPLPDRGDVVGHTEVLRAFVFCFLDECLGGQNVSFGFLPPVSYQGPSQPMMHFVVVCRMGHEEGALPAQRQKAHEFFRLRTLRATPTGIEADPKGIYCNDCVTDATKAFARFRFLD